jgi:putative transposase
MPRRPRAEAATGFYHVVNRSVRKEPLFTQPHDYKTFLGVLRDGVTRYRAPLIAYCVLQNHWHLLVGPLGKRQLSEVMQWVTATHAVRWHRARGTTGQGPVYQGRFTSTPLDDIAALVPMSRYVERNAKSAGLVERAEDWPWCSLAQRCLGQNRVPLRAAAFLTSVTWINYVNATITRRELAREEGRGPSTQRPHGRRSSVPKSTKSVEKGSDPKKHRK